MSGCMWLYVGSSALVVCAGCEDWWTVSSRLTDPLVEMQHVTKLPMVHRATAVAIDDRSRNFAVQQLRPQYR